MDTLGGLLDGPRAQRAFVLRSTLEPPWSIRVEDEAPLTLVVVVAGEAWVLGDDGTVTSMGAGDVAVLRGPAPYTVADDPKTAPQVLILPGQRCVTPDGVEVAVMSLTGPRDWGNAPDGSTTLITGTYPHAGEVGSSLLAALPTQLVVPAGSWQSPVVDLLGRELSSPRPGQQAVLDRLLDLLLIDVLRAWFARPEAGAPGWYAAHSDPVVGSAVRLMQDQPAHPWTIASLASTIGVSRAALARRFTAVVGQPPMAFLTEWRITVACDLLLDPTATVGSVARQVGYGSPFALSTAFKRARGVSPYQHRAAGRSRDEVAYG